MARVRIACLVGMVCALMVGCPSITPAPNGNLNSNTNGNDNVNANTDDTANDNDADGPIVGVETGILVETVAAAEQINLDVYDAATNTLISRAESVNEIIELPAGEYRLTEYFNEDFVVAASVPVAPGLVSRIVLGAITVTSVTGSEGVIYDIYDATGEFLLDRVNDTDEVRPVPAGTYLLKEYFNDAFVFAADVVVTEGSVTTIPLGAINLKTVPGAETVVYEIYADDGIALLDRVNDADTIRNVPPGTYVLTEYFNAPLVFAADVQVEPGVTTEVSLGAVQYLGTEEPYDIYSADGNTLLAQPNWRDVVRSLPAGSYLFRPYFDEETVIAAGVTVTAGEITVVP